MTQRRIRQLRDEEGGWALVTAIILLAIMMIVGTATLAYSNGETSVSNRERLSESGFNLAEGALNMQASLLSQRWQGAAATSNPMPATCTTVSTDPRCPQPSDVRASYTSSDYSSAPAWTTSVRDDVGGTSTTCSSAYSSAVMSAPSYDKNGNGCLWVRADATVSGRTRSMIGLLRVDKMMEQIPHSTLVAGSVQILNSGNKAMVCISLPQGDPAGAKSCDGTGASGPVLLRCAPKTSSSCYDSNKPDVQISPGGYNAITDGYQQQTALSPDALARLKARADADGTHYAGCPTTSPPAGSVVYVDSGDCDLSNNLNTPTSPGMFIVARGTITIGSRTEYDGIVYAMNQQNSSGTVVRAGGNSIVRGGIFVDGPGNVAVGESKINLVFDPEAFSAVESYGTARLVQNRWQEIVPGS